MATDADNLADYERAVARLIERVRLMHKSDWSPTPRRKEIEEMASRIHGLAELLDKCGLAQADIENRHNEKGQPVRRVGTDGLPVTHDADISFQSYKAIIWSLRHLADSAREAAEAMPDPRKKLDIEFAALGFLHLRSQYGFRRPFLSNSSEDVAEFGRIWAAICDVEEPPLSPERLRGVLAIALEQFDPHFLTPGIDELF
jgi:hypothetical protein